MGIKQPAGYFILYIGLLLVLNKLTLIYNLIMLKTTFNGFLINAPLSAFIVLGIYLIQGDNRK